MNTSDLIQALRKVPECRLRLIGLAWKVIGDGGSPDQEKLAFHGKELGEAIAEAEAYAHATREVVRCLREMGHSKS